MISLKCPFLSGSGSVMRHFKECSSGWFEIRTNWYADSKHERILDAISERIVIRSS